MYLQSSKVDMDVHVKTHPRFMDEWVDLLVRTAFVLHGCDFVFGFCLFVECIGPLTCSFLPIAFPLESLTLWIASFVLDIIQYMVFPSSVLVVGKVSAISATAKSKVTLSWVSRAVSTQFVSV